MKIGEFDLSNGWGVLMLAFTLGITYAGIQLTKADKEEVVAISVRQTKINTKADAALKAAEDNKATLEHRATAVGTIPRIEKDVLEVIKRQEVIRESLIRIDERLRPTYPLPGEQPNR